MRRLILSSDWVWDRRFERGLSSLWKTTFICQKLCLQFTQIPRAVQIVVLVFFLSPNEEVEVAEARMRGFLTGSAPNPWNGGRDLYQCSPDQDAWKNSNSCPEVVSSQEVPSPHRWGSWGLEIDPPTSRRPSWSGGNRNLPSTSVEVSSADQATSRALGDIDSEFYFAPRLICRACEQKWSASSSTSRHHWLDPDHYVSWNFSPGSVSQSVIMAELMQLAKTTLFPLFLFVMTKWRKPRGSRTLEHRLVRTRCSTLGERHHLPGF